MKDFPEFYLFASKYPKRKNFTKGFIKLCKDLNINSEVKTSITRYAYDNSDNTAWILNFGEDKKELNSAKDKLNSIEYREQKVFNVSGNGFGTGLSIMLNYNKYWN